ncbi:sensor histidine kinase [Nocardia neocaledoniensis]|uniref:sensor histidine kinase n=1 Tax=Nocardia neocaledoniensis TaxID=236511 RepID=UPI0024570796|nr:nitrate- and nitrite sensing domain-containing protein [Nocardia neocaledoniensis]
MDPIVSFVNVIREERAVSLLSLAGDPRSTSDLRRVWAHSDAMLSDTSEMAAAARNLELAASTRSTSSFATLANRIPVVRSDVDSGRAHSNDVDEFYSQLAGVIADGMEDSATFSAPDSTTATADITAAGLLRLTDLHSRTLALAISGLFDQTLDNGERRVVGQLVGAYRHKLAESVPHLNGDGEARYRTLIDSEDWHRATFAEDELVESGVLPISFEQWQDSERAVATALLNLFRGHVAYSIDIAKNVAGAALTRSISTGTGIGIVSLLTLGIAVVLANRLILRLRRLRTSSLELASERLPSIIRRIHDGEPVDVDSETAVVDDRSDEIGDVADAFRTAQRTAIHAAAAEARSREGFNKVFLDIAHRSQVLVRRQLDLLDIAESLQDDPEHLERLFQLDHLTTRARRNAENLLILGGGKPGRQWRQPVSLEEIVRSAVSETEDFARMSAVRMPDARVLGNVVADLVHLLAELIDNAASFSPPDASITVHGNFVGRGVVVEVEDQGLGIRFDERERLNELLRNPPGFQEMALAGRRHLGLFVVGQLARRHGISVTLQGSAYGGTKAIVLIAAGLLETPESRLTDAPASVVPPRPAGAPRQVPDPAATISPHRALPVNHHRGRPLPARIDGLPGAPVPPPEVARNPAGGAPLPAVAEHRGHRSRAVLPRRQRQTHLVPELQVDDSAAGSPERQDIVDRPRIVADVRASLASFQRGTQQARTSAPPLTGNRWTSKHES